MTRQPSASCFIFATKQKIRIIIAYIGTIGFALTQELLYRETHDNLR